MGIKKHILQINKRAVVVSVMLLLFLSAFFVGCKKKSTQSSVTKASAELYSKESLYIFESVDTEESIIYLTNPENGAEAHFKYDGGSDIQSSKGEVILPTQLKCGEIVSISYYLKDSIIYKMYGSKDAWSYDTYGSYLARNLELGALTVGDKTYKASSSFMAYSNGHKIDYESIVEKDAVTVRGIGNKALSITVTSGHGTVTLQNEDNYVGGWIEIGKVITKVKKGMVLDVPEGEYKCVLTRKGCKGETIINVKRDENTVLDATGVLETKTPTGLVTFKLTPEDALVYVNGSKVDLGEALELSYGKYYVTVKANEYTTYGCTIVVQSPSAEIEITLSKATQNNNKNNSSSSGSSSGTDSSVDPSQSSKDAAASRSSVLQSIQDAQQSLSNALFNTLN